MSVVNMAREGIGNAHQWNGDVAELSQVADKWSCGWTPVPFAHWRRRINAEANPSPIRGLYRVRAPPERR
jgi:hypothetical protein